MTWSLMRGGRLRKVVATRGLTVSKCDKKKKEEQQWLGGCVTDVLTTFWHKSVIYY